MIELWRELGSRERGLLGGLLVALVGAPLVADRYVVSVLTLILYFAYVGQAWNLMMGFAGQLSLGHALYVGLGAYVAALLWFYLGVGPWLGVFAAVVVAMAAGAIVGWLGFRFGVEGVYFALLTIAAAEFTRIAFDHLGFAGGSGGLFLPYEERRLGEWWNLRGGQLLFYYLALFLAIAGVVVAARLARSRLGYHWLAVREDERAARSLGIDAFRAKMTAVLVSSGALRRRWASSSTRSTTTTCVSRSDLRHRPLDRAAARADRRRPRYRGIRPGRQRLHPHPARRGADRAHAGEVLNIDARQCVKAIFYGPRPRGHRLPPAERRVAVAPRGCWASGGARR